MKKFLSMLLALTWFSRVPAFAETVNPDDIEDTMTAEDGKYELAIRHRRGPAQGQVLQPGHLEWREGLCRRQRLVLQYYQPANGDQATDDDRYDAMKAACEGGARRWLCAPVSCGKLRCARRRNSSRHQFVFVDGYPLDLENVAPIAPSKRSRAATCRLCHREGRLHQKAGLHGRRRRHQPRVLPLRATALRRA